jgi:predicted small secreted protein
MKSTLKVLGVIAIVAIIGFSMTACNNGSDGSGGAGTGGGGGNDNKNVLTGTSWRDSTGIWFVSFAATTWDATAFGYPAERGTYTVSGNAIRATVTYIYPDFVGIASDKVGDVITGTIVDENTIRDFGGFTYTKVR